MEWVIALNQRGDTSAILPINATSPAAGTKSSTVTTSVTAETALEEIQSNQDLELVQDEVNGELAAEDEAERPGQGGGAWRWEQNENDGSSDDSSDADVRVVGEN